MPRIRHIKPEFFTSEDTATLCADAQLLYAGLWCMADREGRFLNRAYELRLKIRPEASIDEVKRWIDELVKKGLVLLYGESMCYGWMPTFRKHQKVQEKEKQSVIPAHPSDGGCVQNEEKLSVKGDLFPCQETREGKEREGKEEKDKCARGDVAQIIDVQFAQFWAVYPNKQNKKRARGAFEKALKAVAFEKMMEALGAVVVSEQWSREGGRFVPHATSWLNGERWNDEVSAFGAEGGLSEKKARAPEVPRFVGPDVS